MRKRLARYVTATHVSSRLLWFAHDGRWGKVWSGRSATVPDLDQSVLLPISEATLNNLIYLGVDISLRYATKVISFHSKLRYCNRLKFTIQDVTEFLQSPVLSHAYVHVEPEK